MKKFFNKKLILNIAIPLILGSVIGLLSNPLDYKFMNKPPLSPPSIVFPIVWSILYILMGISNYLTNNQEKSYKLQLAINLIWPLIFFRLKFYWFAVIWLVLLIYAVIKMIREFKNIKKEAAYLNIPYLIWLFFALYLNIGVAILN